ncbi:MAG: class I SAM-dependent methyltransferase [Spirochaetes bacterium]|nr:class I SAM-dependent methyltransferase [Spirochaetota bacterium]
MGGKNSEWFFDENFWEQFAPIMFDSAHWQEVPAVADSILRLAGLKPGRKVLDLCCGFGRVSAELARRGLAVTGVDITESYLATAAEEAAYEKLKIDYVKADARDFEVPAFFDAAVNLYISFGYFENPDDDKLLLRNVFNSLKPGGVFIIETLGKEMAARDFVVSDSFERAGLKIFTEYEVLDSWGFLKNRWLLLKEDRVIEKTFSQRLYCASELRRILLETGFCEIKLFGDWDESPYDHRAAKLIAVGKKPKA